MRPLPGFPAVLACLVVASVLVVGIKARAVVFDDGTVHVIDASNSFPFEAFTIQDGPGGTSTTVSVVPGGEIATQAEVGDSFVDGKSILNLEGGSIGVPGSRNTRVFVRDQATLTVSTTARGST